MRHIDILLTNAIDAPLAPANFGELEIAFHVWEQSTGLPLFDPATLVAAETALA